MSSTTKTTKTVSLVQKSTSFFDDAFFKDAWEDFDTAMQTVLDKFDDKGRKVSLWKFQRQDKGRKANL